MALALVTQITPPSTGTVKAVTYALGAITSATSTDHADISGYAQRVYIAVANGITTAAVWTVQGSHDGINFFTCAWRLDSSAAYVVTARTTTASTFEAVFLSGPDVPRYVRVNVSTPNANGTTFELYAESSY